MLRNSIRRTLVATLVTTASVALLPAAASAAPQWLSPVNLKAPDSDVAYVTSGSDANGNVTAAWIRRTSTANIVEVATRPAGGSFTVKTLQSLPGDASNLTVAVNPKGDAIIAWRRTNATNEIWAAMRSGSGNFSTPQAIASVPGQSTEDPSVAINKNGAMIVVWRYVTYSPSYTETIYGAYRAVGGSFLTAPISSSDTWNQSPRAVLDSSGKATVVWSYWDGSTNIARVRIRNADGSLGAQRDLSAGAPTGYPMFATVGVDNSGNAVAVWSHWNGSVYDVEGASRSAASDVWTTLPAFGQSASASFGSEPQVAVDPNGNAVAIWRAANGTIQAASRAGGGSFGTAQTGISAPQAYGPRIVLSPNGRATAIWRREDADGSRIEGAVRPLGGSFGAVKTISGIYATPYSYPVEQYDPALSADGLGNAIALWPRDNPASPDATDTQPQYAAYDASNPRITAMNAPASGQVGQALGFSASVFDVWSPVTTTWSWGDGTSSTGGSVAHAFGAASAFNVVATARDGVGNTTSASRTVAISSPPSGGGGPGGIDADGDGFFAGQDCNDNNAAINPSAKEIRGNNIDEDCNGVASLLPDLRSTVVPTWSVAGSKSTAVGFILKGLKRGWTVTLSCKGKGCSFKTKKIKNKKVKKGQFNALKKLGKAKSYKAKQTLTVKFTARGYNTKYSIFKFKSGALPSSKAKCQTKGTTKLRSCH